MPTLKSIGLDNRTEGGTLGWEVRATGPRGDDAVTFSWRVLPGTGSVGEVALGDGTTDVFGALEGTSTIPSGKSSTKIRFDIDPDRVPEPSEYIILEIFDVVGAELPFGSETLKETAWIENNDGGFDAVPRPVFVTDVMVTEPENGVAQVHFQFDTPNEPYLGFSLIYRTVSGTATAGIDYVTETGTSNFPAFGGREETQFVTVDILADVLAEGTETFTLEVADRAVGFGTILATGTATIADSPPPAFVLGTSGADDLLGTAFDDQIDLLAGDDTLFARAGDDLLLGRAGHDLIRGEAGADTISGGGGHDTLGGGDGNDMVFGDGGDDALFGGLGDDDLSGGNDRDLVEGNAGDDMLSGDGGDDILRGGAGDDALLGGFGADVLYGGEGADDLQGDDGNDRLGGGAGKDKLDGGRGDDLLMGGAGDDMLLGSGGDDTLRGEDGNDTIDGGNGADFLFGGAGNDVLTDGDVNLSGVDNLHGGNGNDTLRGSTDDFLFGGAGNDQLTSRFNGAVTGGAFGGAGDDYLSGGMGANLFGGDGNDFISVSDGKGFGGAGDDEFRLRDSTVFGGGGDDLFVSGGSSVMYGGPGEDTFVFDRIHNVVSSSISGDPDIIMDFDGAGIAGGDVIELRTDADLTQGGVQDFIFFGALGPGEDSTDVPAGAIWLVDVGAQTRVLGRVEAGRVDDDRRVDFALYINDGPTVSAADYTIDDFIL